MWGGHPGKSSNDQSGRIAAREVARNLEKAND